MARSSFLNKNLVPFVLGCGVGWLLTLQLSRLEEQNSTPGSRQLASPPTLPTIYLITPTYARLTQKADLVRMSQTLRLVPNVHWIVVEDSDAKTPLVTNFLRECNVSYSHRNVRTPRSMQRKICTTIDPAHGCPPERMGKEEAMWLHPRGVLQRNAGLDAVRFLAPTSGVVYFADDDNTYSLELFETMRRIKKVGVWTVGLSGGLRHEGPIVTDGIVTSFHVGWRPERPFPIDMAAFAVNASLIVQNESAGFSLKSQRGYLESEFLLTLIASRRDMEPLDSPFDRVMVWHTRTEVPELKDEAKAPSNPRIEV